MNLISDAKMIIAAGFAFVIGLAFAFARVLKIGKQLNKGEQARIDNEALQNEVTLNAENTQIEEHVDSLSDDAVDAGLRDYYREDSDL